METSQLCLICVLKRVYKSVMNPLHGYSHPHSPHFYTLAQLACYMRLKIYWNTTYREVEERIGVSNLIQKTLEVSRVPDHTTICRMMGKLSPRVIRKLQRKMLEEEKISEEIIGIDGTGYCEEQASVYYQGRCGRSYRRWRKGVYAIGAESKLILAQAVGKGPASDSSYWRGLKREAQRYASPEGAFFVGDAGCDGKSVEEEDIVPPIRRGGNLSAEERIKRQELVFQARLDGVYGERWQNESVPSVIKRKFGDTIRSILESRKKIEAMLKGFVYNLCWLFFPFYVKEQLLTNNVFLKNKY